MRYLILSLLFSCSLAAQPKLDLTTQYVWAESGLTMRAEGKAGAEKIMVIPFGAAVKPTGTWGTHLRVKAMDGVRFQWGAETVKGEPYYMDGAYIEVEYEGQTGYVFDGYLYYYSPQINNLPADDLFSWLAANGGRPDTIVFSDLSDELLRGKTVIHYENGITYSAAEYEGGGSTTITFPLGTLADGFLFAQRFWNVDDAVKHQEDYAGKPFLNPELLVPTEDGSLHFRAEMSETRIRIVGDLLILTSSGGC